MDLKQKTVFIDRDGVINVDSHDYIKSPEEFEFLPGVIDAVKMIHDAGYMVIVITNQSGLSRGFYTPETLTAIHKKMTDGVVFGKGKITDIFYCPHLPDDGCDCRKPKPLMILQAAEKYNIDLDASVMVGDNAKDIECARNAGVKYAVLVKSGIGENPEGDCKKRNVNPDSVEDNLLKAAQWIVRSV